MTTLLHRRGAWFGVLGFLCLIATASGQSLSGTLIDQNGVPVQGADLEFQGTTITGQSNALGVFTVTLPAGTYDVQIIPPSNINAAPIILADVIVAGATNLGTIQFDDGIDVDGAVTLAGLLPAVAGDVDVFDLATGIKLSTPGDTLDLLGEFAIVVPPGTYRFRFEPPAGALYVAQTQILTISADVTLAPVSLPAGFALTGTVRSSGTGMLPIAAVDIDVDDMVTGQRVETPDDDTDALGVFSVVVPAGTFRLTFEPAPGQLFVPLQIDNVVVAGSTTIADTFLDPGIALSGMVFGPGGVPVVGADIDVRTLLHDAPQFSLNDKTGPSGAFTVVVHPGFNRLVVNPPSAAQLVAASTAVMNFTTSQTLPTFNLVAGHLLTGTVTAFGGVPQAGCKIVVRSSPGGALIESPTNHTNSSGHFSMLVPAGTFDVTVATKKFSLAQDQTIPGVVVSGTTVLTPILGLVPMFVGTDDPANPEPQVVPPGGQLLITAVLYNPTGATTVCAIDVQIENPAGQITNLVASLPFALSPGDFVFGQFVPVPLPPILPAHVGQAHKFRLRAKDLVTGVEFDSDDIVFLPF